HSALSVPECASGSAAVPQPRMFGADSFRARMLVETRREKQRTQPDQRQGRRGATGATTAHVRVEIAGGQIVTASITNEAVADLGLKAGSQVIAVIKASDVTIATG